MRRLFFAMLAMALSGCVQVQSTVTAFHTLSTADLSKTLAVYPGDPEEQNSLERKAYVAKLEQHFEAVGFRVIPFGVAKQPDYVAIFNYGIDNGKQVTSNYAIPQWGVTGYSGSTTTGTVSSYGGYGTYNATTTYTPQYGVTGYNTGTTTSTIYGRTIYLTLFDTHKIDPKNKASFDNAKVYEAKLTSSGACGQIASVMDQMLDALFKDFPGESGKAHKVNEPMKSGNGC